MILGPGACRTQTRRNGQYWGEGGKGRGCAAGQLGPHMCGDLSLLLGPGWQRWLYSPWLNFSLKVALDPLQVHQTSTSGAWPWNPGANRYNVSHFQAQQSPREAPSSPGGVGSAGAGEQLRVKRSPRHR